MENLDPAVVLQQIGSGLPNHEILGSYAKDEKLLTLNDVGYTPPSRLRKLLDGAREKTLDVVTPVAWHNAKMLSGLRWPGQFSERLPDPFPRGHGVYTCTVPRGQQNYRFSHWSLYSQGHFYHLTARPTDSRNDKADKTSRDEAKRLGTRVSLKEEQIREPNDSTTYLQPTEKTSTALQAYHVGDTLFEPHEIRKLAEYVISQIPAYNIFSENCQLFVISLFNRIVMTKRNHSLFVGNMRQLIQWDDDLKSTAPELAKPRPYSRATGFELICPRAPDTRPPTLTDMVWRFSWRSLRLNRRAQRIGILYRDGSEAIGAFDPTGQHEGLGNSIAIFNEHMQWRRLKEELQETGADLVNGRWRDFLVGRPERRKQNYVELEVRAGRGDKLTRKMLPFHRMCLGVPADEHRLWAAEAREKYTKDAG